MHHPPKAGFELASQTSLMTLDMEKEVLFPLKAAKNHQFSFHHRD